MKKFQKAILLLVIILICIPSYGQEISKLELTNLPNLPAENGAIESLGFAGMLGGAHNGVLLAAGGANFPEGLPWEGGKKVWSDAIYIFENGQWRLSSTKLPTPLGYSASVSTGNGILSMGGNNETLTSDKVLLIAYNSATKDVEVTEYPNLPEPLGFSSAVVVDGFVYLVGGSNGKQSTNSFYRLALKDAKGWEKLSDFPGLPRALHTTAVQETQTNQKLFVIGGRNEVAGQKSETLTNYLSYDFKNQTWSDEGDLQIDGQSRVLMGASAEVMGSMHIMVYGGSDALLFDELETIALDMGKVANDSTATALTSRRDDILNNHPGFSKDILAYNTITKKWFVYAHLSSEIPVTALAFKNDNDFLIVSGEVSPGIRTAAVQSFKIADAAHPFGVLNYTVLALYLMISVLIGLYLPANKILQKITLQVGAGSHGGLRG